MKTQWKTLPKKTNNAEVVGKPSHDDSEGITIISTEDSTWGLENCPKSYFKYTADETAQSKTTTSTKLRIKSANSRHQLMAQARSRHKAVRHKAGSSTYLGPTGAPKPVPESR